MSVVQRTHFADDDTLAYIAKLEAEVARLKGHAEAMADGLRGLQWGGEIRSLAAYRRAYPKEPK